MKHGSHIKLARGVNTTSGCCGAGPPPGVAGVAAQRLESYLVARLLRVRVRAMRVKIVVGVCVCVCDAAFATPNTFHNGSSAGAQCHMQDT